MTRADAIVWRDAQDETSDIDDNELDDACRALGYDPSYLRGDDEDPIDRRWDVVCAEEREGLRPFSARAPED